MSALLKQPVDWQPAISRTLDGLAGRDVPWLARQRQAALAHFLASDFPNRKNEAWKYTNIHPIVSREPVLSQAVAVDSAGVEQWRLADCDELVFINGIYHGALSRCDSNNGVDISTIGQLISASDTRLQALYRRDDGFDNAFDALNHALLRDGAVITLADHQRCQRPLHLLFISTDTTAITPLTHYVIAGKNSQCTMVESYVSTKDANNLNLTRTNIRAGADSHISYYRCQRDAKHTHHLAEIAIEQAANSRIDALSLAVGGAITRVNIQVALMEAGAECALNGLYMTSDAQLIDHHVEVRHAVAHCRSNQLFKGVVDGRSRAVFNGRIVVDKQAQKSEAHLTNRNLLLSKQADINSKPELEIYADDVKCSHGATVGQLDEQSLFYLQSRGVTRELAQHLLIHAFINDIVERIQLSTLRQQISDQLLGQLPHGEAVGGII